MITSRTEFCNQTVEPGSRPSTVKGGGGGLHPLYAFIDHGGAGTGGEVAILLSPGTLARTPRPYGMLGAAPCDAWRRVPVDK